MFCSSRRSRVSVVFSSFDRSFGWVIGRESECFVVRALLVALRRRLRMGCRASVSVCCASSRNRWVEISDSPSAFATSAPIDRPFGACWLPAPRRTTTHAHAHKQTNGRTKGDERDTVAGQRRAKQPGHHHIGTTGRPGWHETKAERKERPSRRGNICTEDNVVAIGGRVTQPSAQHAGYVKKGVTSTILVGIRV